MSINNHFIRENKVMLLVIFLPIVLGVLASFIIPRVTHHKALAERSEADDSQKRETTANPHMSEGLSGD